jgi:hypothetical protein
MAYSFKVIDHGTPPETVYIPVDPARRQMLYKRLDGVLGIKMPKCESIVRGNMRQQDLMVLLSTWDMTFEYNGKTYKLTVYPGLVFDTASVPTFLVHGNLNKYGQQIEQAALVHDILFNQQLLPFRDANNVFEGVIEWEGMCSPLTRKLYKMGVDSPVGRVLYNKNKPEESWMRGYYEWNEI